MLGKTLCVGCNMAQPPNTPEMTTENNDILQQNKLCLFRDQASASGIQMTLFIFSLYYTVTNWDYSLEWYSKHSLYVVTHAKKIYVHVEVSSTHS